MAEISQEDRDLLEEALTDYDNRIGAIEVKIAPDRRRISMLTDEREALLEKFGVDEHGRCVGCERLLLTGDKAHRCSEGELLCEKCAPTYANMQSGTDMFAGEDYNEDDIKADIEAHLAAGGSLDDKIVTTLEAF